MPDPEFAGRTLSLTAAERHDRLCDRFESGWLAGARPRIEDLLPEVPDAERPALFVALLRVELDRRADSPAGPAEYWARFPAFADLVDTVFRDPAATSAADGDPFPRPPHIDGYELTGTLGQGGMGVVFRGRHIGLDRPVAVKMVRAGAYCPPDQLARFHLEARAVAGLSHANVVTVYDFGQADGLPFIVMELVEGGSLAGRLDGAPADPEWAAGLVERLARAVQHVHDRGLVHRDLKPANVLLAPDGTPKITDFGLVKRLAGDGDLTRTWSVLGTACYMSPEQARGEAKAARPPVDVYGLGAILYECLTGRPPFRAESYELTVVQVLTEDAPRPADLVPGLPADLEAVCLRCLEKDPALRYATAADLADELARYRDGLPVMARPLHVLDRHAKWARRIGYELGDLLGATRWAFTYRARQAAIGRAVRLVLSTGPVGTPAHATLRRQAEAMAGLDHPNVIRLYDYGEQFGQPYLVLEQVEGGRSLARHLRHPDPPRGPAEPPRDTAGPEDGEIVTDPAHAPMPLRPAAELTLMLSLGLQAVHEHGFLHCGLQTGEVVLTRDGTPKIGNFLAARRRDRPADGPDPAWVLPNYQPPEILAGEWDAVRPAADVYALGAILYDLVSGGPPFMAPTLAETRNRIRLEPATPPTRVVPDLDAIVLKCLDKDPAQRYQSAGELALAVQCFLKPRSPADPQPRAGDESTVMPGYGPPPDGAARYRLRVVAGPALVGTAFELPRYRVVIGRSTENDVSLPGRHISRAHCGVVWNEEGKCHEVMDFGAHNGTFVNGERVKGSWRLTAGDSIGIADYVLLFEPVTAWG